MRHWPIIAPPGNKNSRLGAVVRAGSAAITACTLTSVVAGAWTGSTRPIMVTAVDAEIGDTVYWVLYQGTEPTATEVAAGQASGGGSPFASGSDTITALPHYLTPTLPGGIARDNYYLAAVISNGALSNVESTAAFEVDSTAPTLSSPTAAANGSTGATSLSVSTNEGNGTLYTGIYPTASTPTAAQVIAGTGATASTSQVVSGTGTQNVANQTGLTASTAYKAHYVHVDNYGNVSSVSTSAEFTTAAASVSFTDDFDYTSGNLLTTENADWTTFGTSATVTSGTVRSPSASATENSIAVAGISNNRKVSGVIRTGWSNQVRLYTRQDGTGANSLHARFKIGGGWSVRKRVSSSETELCAGTSSFSAGDTISLQVSGTTIVVAKNGTPLTPSSGSLDTGGAVPSGAYDGFLFIFTDDGLSSFSTEDV